LYSKPNNWTFYKKAILKEIKEGDHILTESLKELEQSGWIEKKQRRVTGGVFGGLDIYIHDTRSSSKKEDNSPLTPPTGKPSELCDDFHFQMANSLGDFIETSKQMNVKSTQRKAWANDIRLLMTRDISMREDVKGDVIKAIQAVIDHTGKKYFPVVQSGSAFREKFSKVEEAVKRMKPEKKKETPQEKAARRLREYEEEQRLMNEVTV
jgi:hypothetical protein